MNEAHKPSHDEPRRPLRLQPLPRPPRRASGDPETDAGEASPAENADAEVSAGWIHEWSQPEASADA